jgi:hypothetical protein
MKPLVMMGGLAVALALPLFAAPGAAHASCADRKLTGTVIGGVGGALIGNSISRGGGGAILGGLGGAVVGHEIAGSGCHRYRSAGYYRSGYRERSYRGASGPYPGQATRYVYYDQYGNAVAEGAPPGAASRPPGSYADAGPAPCHAEMQAYYDDRGALVQRPVQICAR